MLAIDNERDNARDDFRDPYPQFIHRGYIVIQPKSVDEAYRDPAFSADLPVAFIQVVVLSPTYDHEERAR